MAIPTGPTLQSFRSVYIPDASGNPAPPSINININARFDIQLQQHIVLWNDILRVFRNARYIQADGALVSFLTNDNFEDLMPLRIAHHPGIQLDVVMEIPPTPIANIPLSPIPPPPAMIFTPSMVPVNTIPVSTATVGHVYTSNNNNDSAFTTSGHQRFRNNTTHGHSQEDSILSINELRKMELVRGTVQTIVSGTPNPSVQSGGNPYTKAGQVSKSHPQALPTPNYGTVTTAAATIAGNRLISVGPTDQLALPAAIAGPPGAPKQPNIQPRPQAWFDPKDISQALQETQDQIQSYKSHVQSRDWHESPLPRLFIVLPKSCLHDDKLTLGWDKFRFFWMCEFVEPAPRLVSYPSHAPVIDGVGLTPHVGHHGGYDLIHPEEFFRKYQAALLLNLQMFKFSAKATNSAVVSRDRGDIKAGASTYSQGVAFLQMSMKLGREEIELYLDLMISHLEQLSSEVSDNFQDSQKVGGRGPASGEAAASRKQEQLPTLNDNELTLIQSYLIATTPTDSGIDQLHNQYRHVDSQGHVQWICLDHMEQLRPNFDPKAVRKAIETAGTYSAQNVSIDISNMSETKTLSIFGNTDLLPTNGVAEMALNMSKADWWANEADDARQWSFRKDFWFGLTKSHLTSLALIGYWEYSYRFLQTSAPLLNFLIENQQLQSLRVESAQGLLKPIKPTSHIESSTRLRVLDFTIDTSEDIEVIKRALAMLVSSATGLRKLRIVWNELNQGGWSTRVIAFLRTFSFKLRESVEVVVKTGEEEISMTVQDGNFQDVHLKVATMAVAEKHPMMWLKALRTLTIRDREKLDSAETKTSLMRILGLNSLLTSLHLECWAVDFQTAEELIKSVVQGVPCGLTKIVLKDSLVDEENGIADELTLTFDLAKLKLLTPITAPPALRSWSYDSSSSLVLAEVRAPSHEFEYSSTRAVGVDNSLFYLNYGPAIRNMNLGRRRFQELLQYLDAIQVGYKRIYLTCLAIHGYWPELPKVLERARTSLKLLAVRKEMALLTAGNSGSGTDVVSQTTLFVKSRIVDFFRGDRLVLVHQTNASDEEVKKLMVPSRCVVTFASDHTAWDRIVSDLFSANKP
ncbi:hypothetical protein BGZ47_009729 [Haplosporangium gracile]|nr:hypothetical protein BGZ47_009729 [Haplosporangium gracile]